MLPLSSPYPVLLLRWGRLWCFLSGGLDLQGLPGISVPGDAGSWGPKCVPERQASPDPSTPLQGDTLERAEVSAGPSHPHVSGTAGQNTNVYGIMLVDSDQNLFTLWPKNRVLYKIFRLFIEGSFTKKKKGRGGKKKKWKTVRKRTERRKNKIPKGFWPTMLSLIISHPA